MSLRRKISVRGWILLVLLCALALGAWARSERDRRFRRYRYAAESFASYERQCRVILYGTAEERDAASWSWTTDPDENRRFLDYATRMRERFEYAAAHPWILARPDPPPR